MSLDDALAAWAGSVRVPAATATDIYQRIVGPPVSAGLDPGWWRDFSADFAATMVTSTRPAQWAA
jgi:hypothetical protein